eukprot:TRINITY_DN1926_c0_g1_i11.p1 TRINITY_DN1926_c0_g1~~TRINITY_DN1926_c0_g1_i11.p1  ORF type:complete len:324 (+),score=123.51 TRINITY_DN1926_c0_g1_i11:65-973(+)
MAACGNDQFQLIVDTIRDGGFQSVKATFVQTVCQNFTFTAKQVGDLLAQFDFTDDRLAAVDLFAKSVIDPSNAKAALYSFDSDEAKGAAAAKLASFSATAARKIAPHKIENDGHRGGDAMSRLFTALASASMSDAKLKVLQQEIQQHPNPPFDHRQVSAILEGFKFSNDRLKALGMLVWPRMAYPMSCAQIVEVMKAFSMSNDKLEVLPALKPFIDDKQNKLTIVASFTFSDDKATAEKILRDVVVSFEPPAMPPAKVQEALKKVGRCPAGYTWRKVGGGYRCSAGGHYVSDAKLDEYMGKH